MVHLTSIKIMKQEDNPKEIPKIENIVDNLTKYGLKVKKMENNTKTNTNLNLNKTTDNTKENENNNDDSGSESEYEIETLDDDESDLEFIPELKKLRKGKNDLKTNNPNTIQSKPNKTSGKFTKIVSTNFMCVMCHEKFPSLEVLTSHIHNPIPCQNIVIKCPICGKQFPTKSRCTAHLQTHKRKQKFPCEKCNKQFSTQVSLQMHSEYNHTEHFDSTSDGWKCKLCNYLCDSRIRVVHHVNGKHLHISAMLCDICGKSFVRESSLRAHIMTHRETRSYLCQICSKGFKMKSSLRVHIKTHNLERSFVCDECGKSFKKNCSLKEHKKYHAGDFPYPCPWCNKRFVSKSLLNTHMKNHTA